MRDRPAINYRHGVVRLAWFHFYFWFSRRDEVHPSRARRPTDFLDPGREIEAVVAPSEKRLTGKTNRGKGVKKKEKRKYLVLRRGERSIRGDSRRRRFEENDFERAVESSVDQLIPQLFSLRIARAARRNKRRSALIVLFSAPRGTHGDIHSYSLYKIVPVR